MLTLTISVGLLVFLAVGLVLLVQWSTSRHILSDLGSRSPRLPPHPALRPLRQQPACRQPGPRPQPPRHAAGSEPAGRARARCQHRDAVSGLSLSCLRRRHGDHRTLRARPRTTRPATGQDRGSMIITQSENAMDAAHQRPRGRLPQAHRKPTQLPPGSANLKPMAAPNTPVDGLDNQIFVIQRFQKPATANPPISNPHRPNRPHRRT